jgi:hypothetical protein
MANIGNIFKDFNLYDLLSDDGNGFDFPPLNESDVKLHEEHIEVDEETNFNLFLVCLIYILLFQA